jgi:pilus assembly protein FimV
MTRKLMLASAITAALTGHPALALELGALRTESALNQPFQGEIDLGDIGPDELDALRVSIAPPEVFEKAKIERYYYLTQLRFTPEATAMAVCGYVSPVRIRCANPIWTSSSRPCAGGAPDQGLYRPARSSGADRASRTQRPARTGRNRSQRSGFRPAFRGERLGKLYPSPRRRLSALHRSGGWRRRTLVAGASARDSRCYRCPDRHGALPLQSGGFRPGRYQSSDRWPRRWSSPRRAELFALDAEEAQRELQAATNAVPRGAHPSRMSPPRCSRVCVWWARRPVRAPRPPPCPSPEPHRAPEPAACSRRTSCWPSRRARRRDRRRSNCATGSRIWRLSSPISSPCCKCATPNWPAPRRSSPRSRPNPRVRARSRSRTGADRISRYPGPGNDRCTRAGDRRAILGRRDRTLGAPGAADG